MPLYKSLFSLIFILLCCVHFLWPNPSLAEQNILSVSDLRETGRLSQKLNLPILVVFSADYCEFCEQLKEEFLIPMLISGDYTDKVIIRELDVSEGSSVINFDGQEMSAERFSQQYKVNFVPTMVLINAKGQSLVPKIIGITTPSLFGGTVDDSINNALQQLRSSTASEAQ